MDKHTLTEVEYSSDSDLERHKADKNNTTVKVPYVAGETFDEMNIYTDTKNIKMAIKWNGITVKRFSNDIILNNCTVKYDLIDDELPDYSIEELLEKYCDKQYLILMAVCTDYSLGITDSIQQFSGKNHGRKGNTYCCSCQSDYEQCSRCASFIRLYR
jgi:hypothetical protein